MGGARAAAVEDPGERGFEWSVDISGGAVVAHCVGPSVRRGWYARLTIDGGAPSVGRAEVAEAARAFMDAFPDLQVVLDELRVDGPRPEYRWTLVGTNTGPGGTGRSVRISGVEQWTIGDDALIASSLGHDDQAEYDRQVGHGAGR